MREVLVCLLLIPFIQSALWEEDGSTRSRESRESIDEADQKGDETPRTDFVRITRASGERHERQISRRLEAFGDGERHMITVDRNGNILQFRRPPSFFPPQQSSPFRQLPPFFPRGITRSRSSHGFSRRRPPVTTRPPTTTVTHDGSMTTELLPSENTLQPPTVTREGTVTNDFRRIPVRTQPSPTGRIHSMRLVHGGSMERERDRSSERPTVFRPIGARPLRPLRISSSFEVLPSRENDRFRIGGPPFGDITTTAPSTRVFIQTPRQRPQQPPRRQRPQQPPRRVEALSNDDQEFIPSGRSPVSPSVVAPFRTFRPRLPSTRFTLPPRSSIRNGSSPLHTSPFPTTSSSSTLTSPEPTTTTQTTTPSTTSATESTTTQSTTSSTTIEATSTTLSTRLATTATTSRPTVSSVTSSTSMRRTPSIASTSSRPTTRDSIPVSPFLHSSPFLRQDPSTLSPTTMEPLHLTPSSSSSTSPSSSPFLPSSTISIQRDPTTDGPSFVTEFATESHSTTTDSSSFLPFSSTLSLSTSTSSASTPSTPSTLSTPSTPLSSSPPPHSSTPDPSSQLRDSSPFINENVRIMTTTRSSFSSPHFDLSELPDEFNFESSTETNEGRPPTPRPKPTPPHTEKTSVKTTSAIGKTTTVSKLTTIPPTVSRVTPPPTAKTRKTGTTRAFATVSPAISVKALPPAMPDDLDFNGIRGPLPPAPLPHPTHSTTGLPPSARAPSFPPSLSFDGPPGEMPPSDNVVQMLNEADDFMDMAKKLNITRKARIARRRRRMAEYGRWRW